MFPSLLLVALLALPQQPDPIYKIGGEVSAPKTIFATEPATDLCTPPAASGGCPQYRLRFIVDRDGIPQQVEAISTTGTPEQTQHVIEGVRNYRFKPAMKAGEPVAVKMEMEVNANRF